MGMTNAPEILKDYRNTLLESLQAFDPNDFDKIVSLDIECEKIASFDQDCHDSPESSKVFTLLHNNKNRNPAVYWFEITSEHTAKQIRDSYGDLQNKTSGLRTIPAINDKYNADSKVLYVGKGNENLSGRMFLHFGYEKKRTNLQGLQLCHWDYSGALKGLKLRLNLIYLPDHLKVFAPVFENELARKFQPILGKHK